MVDIHHHLLFGLDDGSKDIETSIEMAHAAVAEGITHVVCTPHANSRYEFNPVLNRQKAAVLRERLAAEGIPLTLGLGCDFHLSYDNIQAALKDPARYSINGLGYLLVELPDFGLPNGLTETYYELQLAKSTPILTHPERNQTLQADYSRMVAWLRGGLLVQITADSILGKWGKKAELMAHQFLENRWVHFLATDAHSMRSRPPRMREAHAIIAKKYGQSYADLVCIANPTAVFNGAPLPPQEEPLHLYEDMEAKSSWWSRLWEK
jgi:protein-tyrosine phosphatase